MNDKQINKTFGFGSFCSKQIKKQMKLLDYKSCVLSSYLFNNETSKPSSQSSTIEQFDNNELVKLPDTFKNLLYYPNDTVLKSLTNGKNKITKSQLFTIINDIVLGKTKDNYHNVYRAVHPAWFLLFYKEFMDVGLNYLPKYNSELDTFEGIIELAYANKRMKIKEQYCHTFKIYYYLLYDVDVHDIMDRLDSSIIKKLYLDLVTEKYVKPTVIYRGKYIDMCYNFDTNNTLSIEINEKHHDEENDNLRKRQIFARSLNKVIHFYIEDTMTEQFKKELYKEFAKCMYKLNKEIGTNIYMTKVDNFDPEYSFIFTNIMLELQNKSLTLSYLLDTICKGEWRIDNIESIVYKMINQDILPVTFFNNCKNKKQLISNGKIINKDITLTHAGLTKILMYPRKEDFEDESIATLFLNEIAEMYGNFMRCYYSMMDNILCNGSEEVLMVYEQYMADVGNVEMDSAINGIGIEYFNMICEKVSLYKHHKMCPFIVFEEGKQIFLIDVCRKFGENSIIYRKFIRNTECGQIIKNYR